jgi:hypothetical protein
MAHTNGANGTSKNGKPESAEQRQDGFVLDGEQYDALYDRLTSDKEEDPSRLLAFFARTQPVKH